MSKLIFIKHVPLGQGCKEQDWLPVLDPGHVAPPLDGGGLLHRRDRVCTPLPHVWLQVDQLPHAPQLPAKGKNFVLMILSQNCNQIILLEMKSIFYYHVNKKKFLISQRL